MTINSKKDLKSVKEDLNVRKKQKWNEFEQIKNIKLK